MLLFDDAVSSTASTLRIADGTWKLASDSNTSYATSADIMALAHAAGTGWRSVALGFNRYANLPVDRVGVRFTYGRAVDFTVHVPDQDGAVYVWARNLDRAIQLETRARRRAAAANDNTRAWRWAAFPVMAGGMAA